jgi:hypothetical protein
MKRINEQIDKMKVELAKYEELAKTGTEKLEKVIADTINPLLKKYKSEVLNYDNCWIDNSPFDDGLTFRAVLKIKDVQLTERQYNNINKSFRGTCCSIHFNNRVTFYLTNK